ncbi:type II toxin-antitoxin system RelE/ParE family toxin [Alkalilacustris brevis]|uniref:type II toxin-antitoxin system RelE/ParE family toxin n=1 Tax=Alkalilacustris brevis TaxID=2026338 RepID=UPI000E0D640C|nr:type II toxin-antitoxin system RelE/ParE family toxin [Alkalilacustris brevis]
MPQLIWSPAALRDVERLHLFLVEKSASAATEAVKAIRMYVNILADQPAVGRPVEHMAPEFREWIIPFGGSGYIALYRFDGEKAVILAIRHQREAGY